MSASRAVPQAQQFHPDEPQRQSIEHVHGPLLVIAGAGTGKTTVLVKRIARLIREGHARPDEIMAVTYTDNAAAEMKQRVAAELGQREVPGLQLKTFHYYCNDLLARHGQSFGVLDEKDLWIYLRRRIRELDLKHYIRAANIGHFLSSLLDFISRCHDELVTPEQYAAYVRRVEAGELEPPRVLNSKVELTRDEALARCQEIAGVFTKVEAMLREQNLGTFGHMIVRAHDLLDHRPEVVEQERQRARFVLIDEFQDANFAQVKIVRTLAGEDKNVFAVGDPDQSIYRFRGASSAAFGLFRRSFPETRLLVLNQNRRSLTPILQCAFSIIKDNPEVFAGKNLPGYQRSALVSHREEEATRLGTAIASAPVTLVVCEDKDVESFDVAETILKHRKQNRGRWSDYAILYRVHTHRAELVKELVERRIPFTIENMDVMDTSEARDLFACFGAVVSPADGASLFRIAALPQFSVSPEKLQAAMKAVVANDRNRSADLRTVLSELEGGEQVLETVRRVRAEIPSDMKAAAALERVIRGFALDRTTAPICAVMAFVQAWETKPITQTGSLSELLEYLHYFRQANGCIPLKNEPADAVRLMTAHGAKGLEFPHVFIVRAKTGSFPVHYHEALIAFPQELRDPDSLAEVDDKALNEQEERRLFYVAMTRARNTLHLYSPKAWNAKKDATPARYMQHLMKDPAVARYRQKREPLELQLDLAAEARYPSRICEWLSKAPAVSLGNRLSVSAIDSYERCPLQFKLQREWALPREVPAALHYGSAMHLVLKAYFDALRAGRKMEDEALVGLFLTHLANAGIQEDYQYELYEKQGVAQLQEFLEIQRTSPAPDVLHTEESFEIKIGPTTVAGRIDRVDRLPNGHVAILDYKTGRARKENEVERSLQLSVYAVAAAEKWGYQADQVAFYNLEGNTRLAASRSEQELQTARKRVEAAAKKIAAGEFTATPGFVCEYCPYESVCPATEHRVTLDSDGKGKKP